MASTAGGTASLGANISTEQSIDFGPIAPAMPISSGPAKLDTAGGTNNIQFSLPTNSSPLGTLPAALDTSNPNVNSTTASIPTPLTPTVDMSSLTNQVKSTSTQALPASPANPVAPSSVGSGYVVDVPANNTAPMSQVISPISTAGDPIFKSDSKRIPYDDLSDGLAKRMIATTPSSVDEIVLHVNEAPKKASIKIVSGDTLAITDTSPYFIVNSMTIDMEQRVQVYESFDKSYIYLFGEKPMSAQFMISAYDLVNADWFRYFIKRYREDWSAYAAAKKRTITYFVVDNFIFEGAMIHINPQKSADTTEMGRLSLSMIITGLTVFPRNQDFPTPNADASGSGAGFGGGGGAGEPVPSIPGAAQTVAGAVGGQASNPVTAAKQISTAATKTAGKSGIRSLLEKTKSVTDRSSAIKQIGSNLNMFKKALSQGRQSITGAKSNLFNNITNLFGAAQKSLNSTGLQQLLGNPAGELGISDLLSFAQQIKSLVGNDANSLKSQLQHMTSVPKNAVSSLISQTQALRKLITHSTILPSRMSLKKLKIT